MAGRVCVIVNPAAGRGRGAAMLPGISARFGEVGVTDVRPTSSKGEETAIAARAIGEGAGTLVVVGGDGTASNVANTILHSSADVRLAVMPAGTGNDFAKVLGTADIDAGAMARLATNPAHIRIDVGKVEDVFFLNCCGFGFDVAVLEEIDRAHWLRGNSVYLHAALTKIFRYPGIEIALKSSGSAGASMHYLLLVIANTEYFGGMFRIAPGASVTDGMLDAIAIRDVGVLRRLLTLAAAAKGSHVTYEQCVTERASEFKLSFPSIPVYEADGELHRARTTVLTVTSCPSALSVVTAPGAVVRGTLSAAND
jgi:diacylglycerol kinase (ATP)